MPDFGVLTKVDPRDVWQREAYDFTPWLAENLSALGQVLGIDLELKGREAPVGAFSLDLLARDLGSNRTVIIENQLYPTDHDHLGKLITYAAGHDAAVVIWISNEIREEHRQAIDWLNQRTVQGIDFYGVIVEILRIDDSKPAYNFRPVAFPNEWRKTKMTAGSKASSPSERGEAYRAFFQELIDALRDRYQFTGARAGQPQSWYSFASGVAGITYGLSFAQGQKVRVDVYIDLGDARSNKAVFDGLAKEKASLETVFGESLTWERLDDRRASRIALYRSGSIDADPATLTDIKSWAIDHLLKLKKTFGASLQGLVSQLPD